ncbi:inositol monophosphatase family protein [soil metagenome]
MNKEQAFFRAVAPKVIELITTTKEVIIAKHKRDGDYATSLDVASEQLIVSEIKKIFPTDDIMAEEEHSDNQIESGRVWIIDPICGTSNLGKGLTTFCTNIALADSGELIASCVVDHCTGDYYWSVGDGVFVNNKPWQYSETPSLQIDVDLGAAMDTEPELYNRHAQFMQRVYEHTPRISTISLNSSLGFAYTAIGKLDGFVNVRNHPWDICAAAFLLQQTGGVISALDGSEWTITTDGAIAGRTPDVHQKLLALYL